MESKKINQLATSVSPQTSDLTIIGDPTTGVSKKITLLQIANLFATTGTVSSVAVTESGDALTITGSPITSAGTINIGFAGDATQYVRGDGALADFPTSTGGGSSVSYYLNSSVSQGTIGGVAYRELSKDPIAGAGTDITISANGYIASYITDANDPALLEVPGGNFNCEFYFSVNSNAHNPYVYAELYKYDGTTFTLLGSSQSVPEYLTNGTTLSPYYFAIPVATAALTITDRLAVRIFVNVDTRVVTLHTENSHLCQVVTTFSKGLISLNNLTRQNQFFGTGTSGTDFAISSSTATHTFNLPVASATNTGKLSSSDWSTFNAKQPAGNYVTLDTTQTISGVKTFTTSNLFSGANLFTSFSQRFNQGVAILETANFGATVDYTTIVGAVNGLALRLSSDGKKIFAFADATTNNTFTFPNATGTIALTSNINYPVTSVFGRTGAVVATEGDYSLTQLSDVTITTPSSGQVLKYNGTAWINDTDANTGTVTSVGLSSATSGVTIGSSPITTSGTITLAIATASGSLNGLLSSTDWTTFNGKQDALNGTGFVKISGTTISYDNSTYLTTSSASSTYLPLAGGTLTGQLVINRASGNGLQVASDNVVITAATGFGSPRQLIFTCGNGPTTTLEAKGFGGNYITDFNIKTYNSAGTAFNVFFGTSAGDVGIGTDTPLSKLQVVATGTILRLGEASGTTGKQLLFGVDSASGRGEIQAVWQGTSNTPLGLNVAGGNVLIGTTTDSGYKLDVNGTGRFSGQLNSITGVFGSKGGGSFGVQISDNDQSNVRLRFTNTGSGGQSMSIVGGNPSISNSGLAIYDETNAATRLYIASTGAATFSSTLTTGSDIFTYVNGGIFFNGGGSYGSGIFQQSGGTLALQTGTTPRLQITSGGNVGIGTSSPASLLHLEKSSFPEQRITDGTIGFQMYGSTGSGEFVQGTYSNHSLVFRTNATERMRITSGGSVCMGRTSAPSSAYRLAVQDAVMMAVSTNGNNMVNFFNQSDGYVASIVVNASTVSYGTGSDYRLKEDLKDFNGLQKVSAIKVYDFKFKVEGDRMEGVIAHELQKILPYAVTGIKDGKNNDGTDKIQNVDYSKIVPILIKAVQELKAELDELKNK